MSLEIVVEMVSSWWAKAHSMAWWRTCRVAAILGSRSNFLDLGGVVSPSLMALLMSHVKASHSFFIAFSPSSLNLYSTALSV